MSAPSPTLPGGWTAAPILSLVSIRNGQVDPRRPEYRKLPLIAPDHVESGTGRLLAIETAEAQGAISGKYLVAPGDVIYSKIRPYLCKAVKVDFPALCSADMYPLTAKPGVDSSFVLHTLLGERFTRFATSVSARSGIPKINRTELAEYVVAAPEEEEQRLIGAYLDDMDDLIDRLDILIAKKEAVKTGVMQQLLTGTVRLPGFDQPWQERQLAELLSYEQPGPYIVDSSQYLAAGPTPVLTAGKTFLLGYTNEATGIYRSHPVIIFDDFTTASKYVDFNFKVKSSAMKILSARRGVDLRFVYERMQLIDFPLGDHKRYWISEYSKLPVAVPDIKEQQAIAAALRDCEDDLRALRGRRDKLKLLKRGAMQELLSGRTRLVHEGSLA